MPYGEWNHTELAIGKKGYGKTTRLMERMDELNDEAGGAYKIGYSPEMRFPPGSTRFRIRTYQDIRSLERGLRRYPDDFHVLVGEEADPVVKFAKELGHAIKRRTLGPFNRNGNALGKRAVPIILVVDEMMMMSGASGSAQGGNSTKWFRRFLISLRHAHVAFLGGIQDSNAMSYIVSSLADRLWCFRVSHEWALNSMRASGLPKDKLALLPRLEVGEYIEVDI